ncbi:MAG: ATP-binding cassette domain-containing protein [Alphaproteobacteria bacterium]
MRVALAALLFSAPDLLLLDEPTNYLDLEGTLWLEEFLRTYPATALVISHDRDLLNRIARGIVHLDHGKLYFYSGNYDTFERTRAEKRAQLVATKAKQEAARRHMQAYVDRFRAKASKARQAQSRLKMLERLTPIEISADTAVPAIVFPNPRPLAPPIYRLEHASVGYGERVILEDLDLGIDDDDRIALLGANGNGKSTFAKLLSGRPRSSLRPQVPPQEARSRLFRAAPARRAEPQGIAVRSCARAAARRDRGAGACSRRRHRISRRARRHQSRKALGRGKARLALALAAFGAPHLLILDEPTNHLDIESRTALIEGLNAYEGAVILISHDRHLLEACADRLWLVASGTVSPYDGDIEDYRQSLIAPKPAGSATTARALKRQRKPSGAKKPRAQGASSRH